MLQILAVTAFLSILVILPVVMVRGLIQMYRDKNRSGTFSSTIAGSMSEIDRVVRPSVQHVVEAKQSVEIHEDDIGGE
jgi:inner membrane protein involved in colicin E2 resistance